MSALGSTMRLDDAGKALDCPVCGSQSQGEIDPLHSSIPTTGVRNDHGLFGMLVRAPWLFGLSMIGKADGTTLLGMARPAES